LFVDRDHQKVVFWQVHWRQNFPYTFRPSAMSSNKNWHISGGLGGGSSNAATTLIALNTLWGTKLSKQQLAEIGLALGADVPIFIAGHISLVESCLLIETTKK
jgi:4-diphosphocytidyl-2-C-methyl-D-erythritol kinase